MWKSFQINLQNVQHETSKAILIKCPNKSRYSGFVFWHPIKCVRRGSHSNALKISFTDDFSFNLKRYGKNKNLLEEVTLNSNQIIEVFGVMNENITPPKIEEESYLEVVEPKRISADVEVQPCLLNN